MRSGRARGTITAATMALLLAAAGTQAALMPATAAGVGRRLLASSRRGYTYGFLAPVGLLASSAPTAVVVRAAAIPNAGGNNSPRTADLVSRRGGANAAGGASGGGGGMLGSISRLFSGRGGDAIRTEAPAVGALEAAGPGAGEGWKGDLLVLPVFQAEEGEGLAEVGGEPILAAWDAALGGAVAELVQTKEFKGKAGSAARVRLGGQAVKALTLVGLGKKSAFKSARAMGPAAAADVKAEKPKSVAIVLPPGAGEDALASVAEDMLSGLYVDNRFKTGDGVEKPPQVESVKIFGAEAKDPAAALKLAKAFAEGVRLTKDLVGAPANFVTPRYLAETARQIAKEYSSWDIKVLGQAECEARKMGAYLAVAQGSKDGPEFIHLSYKPKGGAAKKLVLIGKGLTFDSGGYNLKAGAGSMIELMKFDMGGAGAVLGAAKALAEMEPAGVEVHVIVAACENMISDKAYRPGDILTASNGKTIEVLNTDAEGRLTLADALVYAESLEPDAIVDTATLTGACIIALGGDYGGLWSGSDELAAALESAAKAKGEKLWRMPLAEEYKPNIKSEIADLKNVGGREGGSITAALFLAEFVKKTPWAHLDIAGPVWNPKKGGATGFGARTLAHWVLTQQPQQ